jgi:hypothetical protein
MDTIDSEKRHKCPYCFKAFNLSECEPRFIKQCGHSICKSCLLGLLKRSIRCKLKCPVCETEQRFIRSDIETLAAFPQNKSLLDGITSFQNQIPMEHCRIHNQEATLFCFDSACNHKNWFCALCIRQFHIKCREELIVSKGDFKQRVVFETHPLGKQNIKDDIQSSVENIFLNFQFLFKEKIDILVEDMYMDIVDVQITNANQIDRFQNYLSYNLDSMTKKITVKRKDDERLSDRSIRLKEKTEIFFKEEVNKLFEKFINFKFENFQQNLNTNSKISNQPASIVEHNMSFLPKYEHFPEQNQMADSNSHILNSARPKTNSQIIEQFTFKNQSDKFLVLEFLGNEVSKSTILKNIMPTLTFLEIRRRTDEILFEEYEVKILPTFLIISVIDYEVHVLRLENPLQSLLINTLCDLVSGDLQINKI